MIRFWWSTDTNYCHHHHEKVHEARSNWCLGGRQRGARGWMCSGCYPHTWNLCDDHLCDHHLCGITIFVKLLSLWNDHLCEIINIVVKLSFFIIPLQDHSNLCNQYHDHHRSVLIRRKQGGKTLLAGAAQCVGRRIVWWEFKMKARPHLFSFSKQVINVYAPDLMSSRPVMVFIHGGGFFAGTTIFYLK